MRIVGASALDLKRKGRPACMETARTIWSAEIPARAGSAGVRRSTDRATGRKDKALEADGYHGIQQGKSRADVVAK